LKTDKVKKETAETANRADPSTDPRSVWIMQLVMLSFFVNYRSGPPPGDMADCKEPTEGISHDHL
jgi:hypothetical protein